MELPAATNGRGWIGIIWTVLQSASPITVALVLVLWYLSIRWMTAEIARVHTINQQLWGQLQTAQQAQTDLAWRCYYDTPRSQPKREE
jgi:hypothetical protein